MLQNLVEKQPAFSPAWSGLGQIARRRGDRLTALAQFRAAAARAPRTLGLLAMSRANSASLDASTRLGAWPSRFGDATRIPVRR